MCQPGFEAGLVVQSPQAINCTAGLCARGAIGRRESENSMVTFEATTKLPALPPLIGSRRVQDEMARNNPFLLQALAEEKREGHRIAAVARTIALVLIGFLLPYLNRTWGVLYYEAILIAFIAIGWLQLSVARVGVSRQELALILLDLLLLTFICLVPNPFVAFDAPSAFVYRFDNFIYFFVLLATGTLAYSWRTVWSIGTWVGVIWAAGLAGVIYFGNQIPELSAAANAAFGSNETLITFLDPNSAIVPHRVQEIVIFFIVAAILGLKGWRSNQLLMRQAEVAAERANLSRYFPNNLVNLLASSSHDIGAVRSQKVAVLFADIVGFTPIAEGNPPEKVMELLRRYHGVIEKAIFENGGTLDKYLGDGAMATFGTPETGPNDALNAFRAGWQIVEDMQQCNRECEARGDPEFQVSVGIHYGPAIIGDIGPSRRLEFAVVGDTVNVASRLESATRQLGCRMIASAELVAEIGREPDRDRSVLENFRLRRRVRLRGRNSPVDMWVGGQGRRRNRPGRGPAKLGRQAARSVSQPRRPIDRLRPDRAARAAKQPCGKAASGDRRYHRQRRSVEERRRRAMMAAPVTICSVPPSEDASPAWSP